MARRLARGTDGRAAAPVRIVHLGLGNFFRAHQAWYTDLAPDAADWGIAAFTGRSLGLVPELAKQGNLYALIERGATGNQYRVISALTATHSGTEVATLLDYFASPELAIVTSTITEAGYLRDESGGLDLTNPVVAADLEALRSGKPAEVRTAPGKFVAGLLARRAAGAGKLTFCPCDNVPGNGEMVERIIKDLAAEVDPALLDFIDENIGFVTTMVDRITPRPTPIDHEALLADQGIDDPTCVATEPFSQWVLSGKFVAGRPDWAAVGAQFVDEVLPFETLKLWLLNGSHTLMAYAATIKGFDTVFAAISDPQIRSWVEEWWEIAARHLTLPSEVISDYRAALIDRFANPNIVHLLAQIAADGSQKVPIRIVPALLAEVAAGRQPIGAERVVAAWILHLRGLGAPVTEARPEIAELAVGDLPQAVAQVCDWLGIADEDSRSRILGLARELA